MSSAKKLVPGGSGSSFIKQALDPAGLHAPADTAAAEQAAAEMAANRDMQWKMYEQSREDMAPWREAGAEALGEYQGLMEGGISQYEMSEAGQAQSDYMAEMTSAAAAAQGQFQSERTPLSVAAARYGVQQGEYETRMNQYAALAGIGQTSSSQASSQAMAMGQQMGQFGIQQTNLGLAQAAAAQQQASGRMQAVGTIGGGIIGGMYGGPGGAMAGASVGGGLGSMFGGGKYT
jgi:hypothetical protein